MPPRPPPQTQWTLGQAAAWWLVARCGCGRVTMLPCRMLARELAPTRTVAEVAERLVCRRCRSRPSQVELAEDPQSNAPGYVGRPGAVILIRGGDGG